MSAVILLTQTNCGWCDQAKAALERLARVHPLSVSEISIESPQGRDLALAHGVAFAPGVLLDGEIFSYGRLPEKKLRRRLTDKGVR